MARLLDGVVDRLERKLLREAVSEMKFVRLRWETLTLLGWKARESQRGNAAEREWWRLGPLQDPGDQERVMVVRSAFVWGKRRSDDKASEMEAVARSTGEIGRIGNVEGVCLLVCLCLCD